MSESEVGVNPYEAPTARLSDQAISGNMGDLIENGRRVPAGHGVQWLRRGWQLFTVAPGTWIALWLVFMVMLMIIGLIPILGGLVNIVLGPLLLGGAMTACRSAENGEPVRVASLFSAFSTHAGPLALLGLLQFAAYIAVFLVLGILAALTIGGAASVGMFEKGEISSAMIVPMIVFGVVGFAAIFLIAVAAWFAPALIVLQGIGPVEALRMGLLASLKNVLPFIVYTLVVALLAIVATLPILLGWFVLAPVLLCSIYAAFRDLFFDPA